MSKAGPKGKSNIAKPVKSGLPRSVGAKGTSAQHAASAHAQPGSSARPTDDQHTPSEQRKIYTDWANHFLEKAGRKNLIADLQVDITNGVLLAQVIEAVIDEKVADINPGPRTANQMIENIDKCLHCLSARGVNTQGLLAKDIREGNLKAVLGLFFALSRFKQQLQQQQQQQRQASQQARPHAAHGRHTTTTAGGAAQHKVQYSSSSTTAASQQRQQQLQTRQLAASTTQAGQKRQTVPSQKQPGNLQSQSSVQRQTATKPQANPRSASQGRPPASKSSHSTTPSPYQAGSKAQGRPGGTSSQLGAQQRKQGSSTTSLASSTTSQKSNSSSHRNSSSSDMSSRIPTFSKGSRPTAGSGISQRGQLEKGRVPSASPAPTQQGAIQINATTTSSQGSSLPNGASPSSNLQPPTRTASQIRPPSTTATKASSSSQPKQTHKQQQPKQRQTAAAAQQQQELQHQSQLPQQQPPSSQQELQLQSQQTPKSPNKSSMLTKLKFFGKEHAGKDPHGTPKSKGAGGKPAVNGNNSSSSESSASTAAPQPARDASGSRSRTPAQERSALPPDKSRTGSGLKKHGSNSSIGTTASNTSSSGVGPATSTGGQSTVSSPGSSLGSSSPKNALKAVAQKTIGRAFGGSKTKPPSKLQSRELGKPSSKDGSDLGVRGEPVGATDNHKSESTRNSDTCSKPAVKSKLSPPGSKTSSSKQQIPGSTAKTKLPVANQSPSQGSLQMPPPSRNLTKSNSSAASQKTGLKTPTSYQTFPKNSNLNDTKQEAKDGNTSFSRGGTYSTFPGPGNSKQRNGDVASKHDKISPDEKPKKQASCKPKSSSRSPDSNRPLPASPSHSASQRSPANTATVAPFNYVGSRPMSKESSEMSIASASVSESSIGSTPIQSQTSVSSGNSVSSENSVIHKPREDANDYCTSVYKNDKVVTTFGTPPSQPRSLKGYGDIRPSNMDLTVMNVQHSQSTSRTTKETTFGDSVTTQLRSHRSPTGSSKGTVGGPSPQGSPRSAIATYGASAARLNNLSSLPLQIPSMPVQSEAHYSAYSYRSGGVPQRFVPAPSLTRLYGNSMRRTTSNRSHLSDLQFAEQPILDDGDDLYDEDLGSGYVSDGDILHRNAQLGDIASGYMSEGGGFLYAKRLGTGGSRLKDGMAAVREFLQKTVDLSDEDSIDDSSSISSGISDTIAEISTDENITGSSISCSSSQASCNLLTRDGIKRGRASSDDSRSPGSSARNSCESGKNLEIFGDGGIPINSGKSSPQRRTLDDVRRKNGESSPRRSALSKSILKEATAGGQSPKRNGSGKNGKGTRSDQGKGKRSKGDTCKSDREKGQSNMSGYPERGTLASPTGRTGIPPPPSWQRSLDRIQVRQTQAARHADPSLSPSLPRSRTGGIKYDSGSETLDRRSGARLSQRNKDEQEIPGAHDSRKMASGRAVGMQGFGFRPGASGSATTPGGKTAITPSKSGNFGFPGSSGKSGRVSGSLSGSESAPERSSIRMKSGQRAGQKLGQKTSPTSPPGGSTKADVNSNTELKKNQRNQEKGLLSPTGSEAGKAKLGGSKSGLSSSPSLKQLFGRKPEGAKTPGSAAQDTIISNPHATLAKPGTSPPRHPQTSTPTQFVPMSAARRASANMSADLSLTKTPYSDALRYSGYLSDSYSGARDSGLGSLHAGMMGPYARGNMHPSSLSTLNRSESGSMESLDSNNSSSLSMTSRATSERYGLTSPSSNGPSPHHRAQPDKMLSISSLSGKDAEETAWLRANGYPTTTDGAPPLSPASSTASQPVGQFFAIPGMNQSNSAMVRSNSMSASSYSQAAYGNNPRLRNNSVSLDERQRAALSMGTFCRDQDGELHGSALSLMSQGSSLYGAIHPDDKANEIRRLKRELDREQERVGNLSNQLNTNAHVVAAFEQSLSNMTNRLQQLTSDADQKDSELQELRTKIELLKYTQQAAVAGEHQQQQQQQRNGQPLLGGDPGALLRKQSLGKDSIIFPEVRISRQLSTDSMSSLASMTSMSSFGSAVTDSEVTDGKKNGKKKKHWISSGDKLRSSFRAAFSRKKKNGTSTDTEDLESNSSFQSGGYPANQQLKSSASTSAIYDAEKSQETINDLKRKLREKESKLTDVKLEALSSQHQLDQMKESMSKMKNELSTLKQENERLQRQVVAQRSLDASSSQASLNSLGSSKRLSRDSLDRHRLSMNSDHGSLDILLDDNSGMTNNSQRIIVTVAVNSLPEAVKQAENVMPKQQEVFIGTIGISSKTNWDTLDSVVKRIFKEYVLRIDPVTNIGLSAESVHSYVVGEITRTKDSDPPELLPCGYLVGDNTSIQIHVKGVQQNSCDRLVFETLIPKPILQRYISLLLEHRRIILCGPSGTGKTFLAQRLADHIVQRSGKESSESTIAIFNVDHKSSKELKQYLTNVADQCETGSADLPSVIILDNLHHVGSLGDIFNGFLSYKYHKCPFIIGTMNQATCSSTNLQLHHNFRWVLCANHMEPVKGFLGRFLRRKLVEKEIRENVRNNDLNKIIDWIPKVWQHLNKFLESHSSSDVTIGPRLFLSCPVDLAGSQVWFTDLWNYSIVPYLLEAVREGLQLYGRKASWEDPAEWVIDSYPWQPTSSQDWPSLLRLRPEDVGFDGYTMHTGVKGQQSGQSDAEGDPLFNMLMRLQEAANLSGAQSCDSDTNSIDSVGMSTEDIQKTVEIAV
ncbi:neuron navigator 2-like isoform X3 [Acanthaster planci]|uniref:Neuron navigator 2-like isoform X3 n=1 Tax=Acanthaster planci TaxID=133434 RepID=A0A8B8A508_ACAPL|nr:neuron navigator 2-like isoform X3 [Acanthaster planci]